VTAPLSLAQRLLLVKWLGQGLAAVRKDDLLPQGAADLPPGSRIPVMFGGRLAGWVTMPKPMTSATVTDEGALLAWAEEHQPGHVEDAAEVAVCEELVAYLGEHAPQFLRHSRRPDPQWAADVLAALQRDGRWVTRDGEPVTEVPGVTVSKGSPVPRVTLGEDAAEIIGAAWRDGLVSLPDVLALPAGNGDGAQ